MKSYSIPWINIVVIVVFLYFLGDVTINSFLDPNYLLVGAKRIPRAIIWYITVYLCFKFLTTAYKISFLENGSIELRSILRSTSIEPNEIKKINSYVMFVDIVTEKGNYSVSSLMVGVSNIKEVLLPLVKDNPAQEASNERGAIKVIDRNKVFKIIFIIVLVAFAIYIEWQQLIIFLNKLKSP